MHKSRSFLLIHGLVLSALLAMQGCSTTSHLVAPVSAGQPSSSGAMERLIDQPGPIEIETIDSADWRVPLSGLLNLNSEAAKAAHLTDRDEPIQVFAHVIRHPQRGIYLVDTGVSHVVVEQPDSVGLNWMIRKSLPVEKMKIKRSAADIVGSLHGKLAGVFFTHLHIDHIAGMPELPNDVQLFIGPSESSERGLLHMFTQSPTNALLQGKPPFHEWNFQPDPDHQFQAVTDVFGDGTIFAISVPGHTSGSTAYLVRTPKGPVLLTGDACHTRWGWEHGVEPGTYTDDQPRNLQNLIRLKALVARHPGIDVRLGHQY